MLFYGIKQHINLEIWQTKIYTTNIIFSMLPSVFFMVTYKKYFLSRRYEFSEW